MKKLFLLVGLVISVDLNEGFFIDDIVVIHDLMMGVVDGRAGLVWWLWNGFC